MTEGEEKFVDPELAEELAAEELPEPDPEGDPFWADKDPEEHVAREFVGDRQLTVDAVERGQRVRYRVGLGETGNLVADRLLLDRYSQESEPTEIDLASPPESPAVRKRVREMFDELLAKHFPEAVGTVWPDEAGTDD